MDSEKLLAGTQTNINYMFKCAERIIIKVDMEQEKARKIIEGIVDEME